MFSQIESLTIHSRITSGAVMSEEPENSEPKRIDSLEDADNKESNRQLMWSLGALSLGFVIILIVYL